MERTVDQADLDMLLRGRPLDLQPVRPPSSPPSHVGSGWLTRALRAVGRQKLLLALATLAGLITALILIKIQPPVLHTTRTSIDVPAPSDAEAIVSRALAEGAALRSAEMLKLRELPEYAEPWTLPYLWSRFTGSAGRRPMSAEDFRLALEHSVKINTAAHGRIIDLEFRSTDPGRATSYLNALAEQIVHTQDATRLEAARQTGAMLAAEIERARAGIDEADKAAADYARTANLLDPRRAAVVEQRIQEVERTIAAARAAQADNATPNSEIIRLTQSLSAIREQVAATRAEQIQQLNALRKKADARRVAYDALGKKMAAAEAAASQAGTLRQIAPARITERTEQRRALPLLLLGAVGGLLLGIPLCLLRDSTDHTIRRADEIAGRLGIPILGEIPHAMRKRARSYASVFDTSESLVSAGGEPLAASPMGEAYRNVLASLWIAGQSAKRPRMLVLASPGRSEGKTTLAVNLGIALADSRRRVLVIDANLRTPRIHEMFGAPPTWGLAEVLEEDRPIEDYDFEDLLFQANVPGLYLLPAGGASSLSIAGMRHIDRLAELLMRFRLEFHAVLIDTPAALAYPDARILARLADAAVMIVRAGASSDERAADLARQFETDGVPLLGAVLNDAKRAV